MNSLFSPRGLFLRAVVCGLVFAGLHLAGLREYTGLLTMTRPPDVPYAVAAVGATAYLLFYLATVLVAPVMVIAAGLLWGWNRWSDVRLRRTSGRV